MVGEQLSCSVVHCALTPALFTCLGPPRPHEVAASCRGSSAGLASVLDGVLPQTGRSSVLRSDRASCAGNCYLFSPCKNQRLLTFGCHCDPMRDVVTKSHYPARPHHGKPCDSRVIAVSHSPNICNPTSCILHSSAACCIWTCSAGCLQRPSSSCAAFCRTAMLRLHHSRDLDVMQGESPRAAPRRREEANLAAKSHVRHTFGVESGSSLPLPSKNDRSPSGRFSLQKLMTRRHEGSESDSNSEDHSDTHRCYCEPCDTLGKMRLPTPGHTNKQTPLAKIHPTQPICQKQQQLQNRSP